MLLGGGESSLLLNICVHTSYVFAIWRLGDPKDEGWVGKSLFPVPHVPGPILVVYFPS